MGVEFKIEEIPAEKISEFNVGGIARLWPEGVHSVECRVSQRFVLLLLDWAPESFMFQIRRRMETEKGEILGVADDPSGLLFRWTFRRRARRSRRKGERTT